MLASAHPESHGNEAKPVCLDGENPNRLVRLSCAHSQTVYCDPPGSLPKGPMMEFRLVYKGMLPAETSRPRIEQKHSIRKALHPQLKELWNQYPFLRDNVDYFAENWHRCGYRFVPLITRKNIETCALDILFLRRDQPGNIIRSGGDIDNRLKVLFDGLRMIESADQLPSDAKAPAEGEDPFFCLLEDDELVTQINVTTDRLLVPQTLEEHIHTVELIIHVKAHIAGVDSDGGFVTTNGKIVSA